MTEKSCPACYNVFLATSELNDRRPMIACGNGDSICADCFGKLRRNRSAECPVCGSDLLPTPIVNKTLLEMIETYASVLDRCPEIPVNDLNVEKKPFAKGGFGKVYDAKWRDQNVAIKVVISSADIDKQIKELKYEAYLAIGLLHPNVIRLFGSTWVKDEKSFGIVMEKAEHGSLDKWIGKMEHAYAAKTAMGIIDGLDYVHKRKVVHRDLKPQNILMCGPREDMIPKIADFGLSKVIQTVTMHTAVGTPLYMAPEVRNFCAYGSSADIYSLAMMLFEMFSGQLSAQEASSQALLKVMIDVIGKRITKVPENFKVPVCLRDVIERGWDETPEKRPSLSEYRSAMKTLVNEPTSPVKQMVQRNVSKLQQAQEMANVNIAIPLQGMSWSASCENLNSKQLRSQMIDNIKSKSNMASLINDSVLSVMNVVPRHIFIEVKRLDRGSQTNQQEVVNTAYVYHKPIPATMNSNESSPEIVGTQLSMTEIIQGQSVLLVGMKGGYIQSLIAQMVGIHGSVVTVTADEASMNVCRDRVNQYCPWKSNIDWIKVSNIKDRGGIVAEVKHRNKLYHTVIYCGAVEGFPMEMKELLYDGADVSIMAPVKEGGGMRFQLYLRRGRNAELRTITDFGVIFEDAH